MNHHHDLGIKLWIAFGAICFFSTVLLSIAFVMVREKEHKRYIGCVNQARSDCAPSFTWTANGWGLDGVPPSEEMLENGAVPIEEPK